jgi:hypothetical protein
VRCQPLDLLAQAAAPRGGLVVFGLQQPQEFAGVHAASSTSSRQARLGVVRRRSMPAVEVDLIGDVGAVRFVWDEGRWELLHACLRRDVPMMRHRADIRCRFGHGPDKPARA